MPAGPAAPVPQPGMLEKVGFGALTFFMFAIFSSVPDMVPGLRSIRPSLIAAVVGLVIVGISGRVAVLLRNPIVRAFIALTVWLVLCIPFSIWPGGSASTVLGPWLVAFLALFMAGGLIWSPGQLLGIVHLIACSAIILAVIALALDQQSIDARLMLEGSRYVNPNDLAMMGLTSLPFLGFMAMRKGNGIRRPLALGGSLAILLVIAKTGSRGAEIGAAMALLAVFLNVRGGQKLKLLIGGAVAFTIVMLVLPPHITRRFTTIFGDSASAGDDLTESAIGSSQNRRTLLLDSIRITFQRPAFGVGPGNFQVEQDKLARARGEEMGNWRVTHKTYTQFSSESGIPGLLFFLTALFFCFRSISRTLRMPAPPGLAQWQDLKMIALTLRISLVAFLTCAFFDSLAYSASVTVLLGLSVSLEYCAVNLAATAVAPAMAAPAWQVAPSLRKRPAQRLPGRPIRTRI